MTELTPADTPRPRAYSYLRFSTPEQMEGDSLRRQSSLATEYAHRHGLELDEELSYRDLGVSAFRSGNANVGKLAEFLEAVRVGQVPVGSYLLVESLDRISRDHAFDAQALLSNMIQLGVTVVTLLDERIYSLEGLRKDPMGMMYSIMGFMRAHEESAVKSRRLKQAWGNKRTMIAERPLTRKAPAWLAFDDKAGAFVAIPDRADLVQRIFSMTLEGIGQHKIAESFNLERIPTWGRAALWHRSYVSKILNNPAVIGTIIPHMMEHVDGLKRRVATEPVLNYYPAVISEETWAAVQALQAGMGKAPRGKQAAAPITNILAFVATCPRCGKTMTRVQKGKKSSPALVCTVAKSKGQAGGGCEYKSVRYQPLEDRLVRVLPGALADQEGIELPDDLENEIWNAQQGMYNLQDEIETLLDNMGQASSASFSKRLLEREALLQEAKQHFQGLVDRRETASGRVIGSRVARAVAALQPADDAELDRKEINLALRGLFKRAVINWPAGTIDLEWHVGGVCRVHYGWTGGVWPQSTEDSLSQ
jgi:DNA invertase Pin-like site-specific DNA recombinase